jgi:hypothetical protein
MKTVFAFAFLAVLGGCSADSGTSTPAPMPEIRYYVGTSTTTSPDGSRVFATDEVAVKRTVDAAGKQITELVVHKGESFPTTLTERGDTNVFDADDGAHSFAGTITFQGTPWSWNSWDYALTLTAGGTLAGHGDRTEAAITTAKVYAGANGVATAQIREDLKAVDAATYTAKVALLNP